MWMTQHLLLAPFFNFNHSYRWDSGIVIDHLCWQLWQNGKNLGLESDKLDSKTGFNNVSTLGLEQVILTLWACIAFFFNKMQILINEMQNGNKRGSTEVLTCNQLVGVSQVWFFKIVSNYFMSVCFPNLARGEQALCFISLPPHKSSGYCYVKLCGQLINLE